MGGPGRVSAPNSGGGWTARAIDAPRPEARVGPTSVPVDHDHLDRFGWDERSEEGRRRVVRSALRFAAGLGVHVAVPPAAPPREVPAGAYLVVEQPPPREFRSNGEWAGDLMKRIARHVVEDPHEGPRAVESLMLYGLTGSTRADYAGALAEALGYLRDRLDPPARRPGGPRPPAGAAKGDLGEVRAALACHVRLGGELWGSPASPYACARVMTRAHTGKAGSPLIDDVRRLEMTPPDRYGDTVGGWFAWHLAETRPWFRDFDPRRLAADCDEWLSARAAEDLLREAASREVAAGVAARLSSGEIRGALEALPVPADDPAVYGSIVSSQAMGWNRHPLNRARIELPPAGGVEPAGFRALDSRRREDAVMLEDRVLGVCAGSGVAVRLCDSDRVTLSGACGRGTQGVAALRPPARVRHPIPERFASTEDWGRSLLSSVALAVVTHPRLYNDARLDGASGRRPEEAARMLEQAARAVSDRYRLDPRDIERRGARLRGAGVRRARRRHVAR